MEPISNGVLDNVTSQGLNDSITYSCVEGYELVGSATRTCQLNGNWSGSEPYCQGNTQFANSKDYSHACEIFHALLSLS